MTGQPKAYMFEWQQMLYPIGCIVLFSFLLKMLNFGRQRSSVALDDNERDIFKIYRRFVVVGCSASGKSTLAAQLCSRYPHLKQIECDNLWWLPDWQARDIQTFRHLLLKEINESKNGWIIAGNYDKAKDIIWGKAQVVIWLDYGFWHIFYRGCKRTFIRILYQTPVCNGNFETLSGIISEPRYGIPCWIWRSYNGVKEKALNWTKEYPDVKIIRISSPKHCEEWLCHLDRDRLEH